MDDECDLEVVLDVIRRRVLANVDPDRPYVRSQRLRSQ